LRLHYKLEFSSKGRGEKEIMLFETIATANGQVNLQKLEERLQKTLNAESLADIPLQIHCLLRETALTVFIRYPETAIVSPKKIFARLREAIQEEQISPEYAVSMYLIWQGQEQADSFTHLLAESPDTPKLTGANDRKLLPGARASKKRNLNYRFRAIAGLTGLGVIISLASLYALTRPCVMGNCMAIPQTSARVSAVLKTAGDSASERDLTIAQQQYKEAIATLETIPVWSKNYAQAEALRNDYQQDLENLNRVIVSIATAKDAIAAMQNPTQSPLSQQLWQAAIAQLQTISSDSPWYATAQNRVKTYKNNLASIEQRDIAQKQAGDRLIAAKEAANIAQIDQNTAQTPTEWQAVYTDWQNAIKQIKEITPQTTSYAEAQKLLPLYTQQLVAARTRQKQEESANSLYQKAVAQAKLASAAESKQQWSEVTNYWQSALTYITQVPKNTFQYRKAEPLIASYTVAYNRATQMQQADLAFGQLCNQEIKICSYTLSDNTVKVKLTAAYMERVQNTALQAQTNANAQTQADLLNYISALEQNIQALANNLDKRVDVYNADGQVVMVYKPLR
jgi:hypothetical protein